MCHIFKFWTPLYQAELKPVPLAGCLPGYRARLLGDGTSEDMPGSNQITRVSNEGIGWAYEGLRGGH